MIGYECLTFQDRVYCDGRDSDSRHAALSTMIHVTRALTSVLAPVLPHVCHEVAACSPVLVLPLEAGWACDEVWGEDNSLGELMVSLERLREEVTGGRGRVSWRSA